MLKHIVMWNLKPEAEGADAFENAKTMKRLLEGLKDHIPEILELEVGLPLKPLEGMPHAVIVSAFKDEAALEIYQKHPEHQKVVEFVKKVVAARHVVDY
jgi:quinol monooxygenase YgiN